MPTPGLVIADRYRLEARIDSGGMAQVWSAIDERDGSRVAVKILHPHLLDDAAFLERFRREAAAAARLRHPNIVAVHDTCSIPGLEAIVMEFVDGVSLRQRLDTAGVLEPIDVVEIGCRVADALGAAHAQGLVHRDVKPANILIADDQTVRLADFGIAKSDQQTEMTVAGSLVGTATYLSPEQVLGERTDGRSDLYSLGVVLYEAACGSPPFHAESPAATALVRLHQAPPPLSARRTALRPALCDVIMRCLERNPDDRYPDAAALRDALGSALTKTTGELPVVTLAKPTRSRAPRRTGGPAAAAASRRRPPRSKIGTATLAVLIASALAVITLLVVKAAQGTSASPPPTTAPRAELIPIAKVETFDPRPLGDGMENDSRVGSVIEGLPSSAWSTEAYNSQEFGTKRGVGLLLTLPRRSVVDRIEIDSPDVGWSVEISVLDTLPTGPPAQADATASATGINGSTALDTTGHPGTLVLVWITRLGNGRPRYNLAISAVRVMGRPAT